MPKRRRKGSGSKSGTGQKDVGLKIDGATYNRLIKAAAEFNAAIVAVAAVCVDKKGRKKPRRRRKPRTPR